MKLFDLMTEKGQLAAVKYNGYELLKLKDPSEEVQIAAVKQYGYMLRFIENPSEKVKLAAVKQIGWTIKYITDPSEKVQLAAVKRHSGAITYLENPSDKVKKAAALNFYPIFKQEHTVTIGCKKFTVEEWRSKSIKELEELHPYPSTKFLIPILREELIKKGII